MKIFLTCPSLFPHGGIRVILEWANRLSKWHTVYLRVLRRGSCDLWFDLSPKVKIVHDNKVLGACDCLIITSPHSINFQLLKDKPKKVFVFAQALEHMLQHRNAQWQKQSRDFYLSPHPLFYISGWGGEYIKSQGRTGKMILIGNGVNLEHFPIKRTTKSNKTVLVEGWSNHPVKDPDRIVPAVTKRLMAAGCKVLVYSSERATENQQTYDRYYVKPSLDIMNSLYSSADIFLKATKYDACPSAPMEAMTKGTVSVIGKIEGYDQLVDGVNASVVPYNASKLFDAAVELLENKNKREAMSKKCLDYVATYNWDYWMEKINGAICS